MTTKDMRLVIERVENTIGTQFVWLVRRNPNCEGVVLEENGRTERDPQGFPLKVDLGPGHEYFANISPVDPLDRPRDVFRSWAYGSTPEEALESALEKYMEVRP